MKACAIASKKGGVGKTTLTTNLAHSVAKSGQRVLVVDADPQANASEALAGIVSTPPNYEPGLIDAIDGADVGECIVPAAEVWGSVSVLAADERLESLTMNELGWEHRFSDLLAEVDGDFDLVLFDCPPSLGVLTLNALVASDGVLVATEAGRYSLGGVRRTLEVIAGVEANTGRTGRLAGVIFNGVPTGRTETEFRVSEAKALWGKKIWDPSIPHAAVVHAAVGDTVPVAAMGGDQRARARAIAECYDAHADRLMKWLRRK